MAPAVTSGLSRISAVSGLVTHYINANDVGATGTTQQQQSTDEWLYIQMRMRICQGVYISSLHRSCGNKPHYFRKSGFNWKIVL
jgi:hypothetical protein